MFAFREQTASVCRISCQLCLTDLTWGEGWVLEQRTGEGRVRLSLIYFFLCTCQWFLKGGSGKPTGFDISLLASKFWSIFFTLEQKLPYKLPHLRGDSVKYQKTIKLIQEPITRSLHLSYILESAFARIFKSHPNYFT